MSKAALIFGNANYSESPLINPVNDAEALKDQLSRLGFQCITSTNAKVKEMDERLAHFS